MNSAASQTGTLERPTTRYRYWGVGVATVAVSMNYCLRVTLSVVAPQLMDELSLSAVQMGYLISVFFWSYTLMMIPGGALINKFGPRKIMGIFTILSGVVTMLTGTVTNFAAFIFYRIVFGITSFPAFPAASRIVSLWAPKCERTMATAWFDGGARIGSMIAPPIVAFFLIRWGWRSAFIGVGVLSFIIGLYIYRRYADPGEHPKISESELAWVRQDEVVTEDGEVVAKPVPILQLFTYRRVMQACFAYAGYLYCWSMLNGWMPAYLVQAKGVSIKEMGFLASVPYLIGMGGQLIGGYLFNILYRKGVSINLCRRGGAAIGLIGTGFFIYVTTQVQSPMAAVAALSSFLFTYSCFASVNVWSVPNDIAPYGQAGGVAAMYSFIGNFAALLAPIVTGYFVKSSYGYNGAFMVCVVVSLISAFLFATNTYERIEPRHS